MAAIMAGVLILWSSFSEAQTYTMRVGHSLIPDGPRDRAAKLFKSMVEKRTGGRLKVEVYPASQLGDNRQMLEGVQLGTIEAVIQPTAFMGGFSPFLTIFDLPFLFTSRDIPAKLAFSDAGKVLLTNLEKKGIVLSAIWIEGLKQFTNNKLMIKTPNDFRGIKFRTMPAPVVMESYKAYGATPIPISVDELYNALQLGTVDGGDYPVNFIYDMKIYEVQKYLTIADIGAVVELFAVSKKWFDKLPPEFQKAIFESAREITPIRQGWGEKLDEECLDKINKMRKMQVYTLTAKEREAFRELSGAAEKKFVEIAGSEGGALLDNFKRKIKELQK
jgi:C4-dicarboxylate-binding protein DctP